MKYSDYLNESPASDRREKEVAKSIRDTSDVKASRPRVGPKYSDVKLRDGVVSWLEVKMNHTDQLGNVRAWYDGSKWRVSVKDGLTPLKKYIMDELNKSNQAKKFVQKIADATGIEKPFLVTTPGQLKNKNAVQYDDMVRFMKNRSQYIHSEMNVDLGDVVTGHYNHGKAEPAHYMQAADDFYRLGAKNPLKVPEDVALMRGRGSFRMRVSIRKDGYYEIQPSITMTKMNRSKYSVLPGTKKKNPFKDNK